MLKLQAREIIRAAKKMNITLHKGSRRTCAIGVIAEFNNIHREMGCHEIASKLGYRPFDLIALEAGFEGGEEPYVLKSGNQMNFKDRWLQPEEMPKVKKNRYYRVGQRIAELAGI